VRRGFQQREGIVEHGTAARLGHIESDRLKPRLPWLRSMPEQRACSQIGETARARTIAITGTHDGKDLFAHKALRLHARPRARAVAKRRIDTIAPVQTRERDFFAQRDGDPRMLAPQTVEPRREPAVRERGQHTHGQAHHLASARAGAIVAARGGVECALEHVQPLSDLQRQRMRALRRPRATMFPHEQVHA